jgi:signal transduction histidine kinase
VVQLTRRQGNVHFSLDGRHLAFAEREVCRIYRTSDWNVAWETRCAPSATFVGTAAFSHDGKLVVLATSPRSAKLFDVASGRELAQLEAPSPAPIAAARWTPDGERIVFSTRENQLDVWKPAIMQHHLSVLGLGWDSDAPSAAAAARASAGGRASPAWIGAGVLATVALVAVVATLSLRRHRRLISDFSRTEALAAQRELELQGEREVSRLKSGFVSMVSHEFRTPLGIIQSSAQILDRYLERLSPERRTEQLESINRNVERMAGLIDEVLLIGKVEAGQLSFAPAPLDLAGFCRRLADEMTSATHRRCPIRLVLETPVFPLAQADEGLLRHILANLISNAVKYSVAGNEVEFHVAQRERNAVFTIRDRGIGIPEADRDKLFVAFQRASNAAHVHGTGLGLTIVKRCVDRHGGEVSFTSEEGRGTTFTVTIPMFSEPDAAGGQ